MAATAVLTAVVNRDFIAASPRTTPSISYVAVMKACMSTSIISAVDAIIMQFFVVSITCDTV